MKHIYAAFIYIALSGDISAALAQQWELVWSDEFSRNGLPDTEKWNFDTEGNSWDWGNQEAQNYTPAANSNAWVENGMLIIEARKEDYYWHADGETKNYTSARLTTKGKGDWLYCRVEVRALLPTGRGVWPAIWMLPTADEYGSWPSSGELDIMENVGYDPNELHCNIHTQAYHHSIGTNKGASATLTDPSLNWHIYSMEWNGDNVSFYCNGLLVFSYDNEKKTYREWPFDKEFHLLLNIAVGGSWAGRYGIDDGIFPQRMAIDYVRVFQSASGQQEQAAFGGAPRKVPGIIQFEDFDTGGQGLGYYDATRANMGNANYRMGQYADIDTCSDTGGGYYIGWADAGEWLRYTVDVEEAGLYDITIRAACADYGRTVSIFSGKDIIAPEISIPFTGGWQNWQDITIKGIKLNAGLQALRLEVGPVPHVNLNYMSIQKSGQTEAAIILRQGWNLIGFPFQQKPLVEAFAGIMDYLEAAKDQDNVWLASQQQPLNQLNYLIHGRGYWVKVNRDCILEWFPE
jgi:beta-glucanase (GH16 family)